MTANHTGSLNSGRWRDVLAGAALVGWVFFVYRESFSVYFLNEDFTWLRHCRLTPGRGLWTLLTRDALGGLYSWRPLPQAAFGVNYALGGLHPLGYRLTSLACHTAAVCLLYAALTYVTDRFGAMVAAVIFAAHPLHVESLSWTCAWAGPMSSALLLLGVVGYLRWRDRHGSWLLALLPLALALGTQESVVIFPLLLLTVDLFGGRSSRTVGSRVAVYAAVLAIIAGFFLLRRLISPAASNFTMVGLDPRFPITAAQLPMFLLLKLRTAAALLLTASTTAAWWPLVCIAALGLGACLLWWRGKPLALLGLLWMGIGIAPYSLLLFGPVPRYMHLSAAGFGVFFAAMIAAAYHVVARRHARAAAIAAGVLLVVWLGHVVQRIDAEQASLVRRGNLTRALLDDLVHTLPNPRPGSMLAFEGLGDLPTREAVFVFGLQDAVRLLYEDASLTIAFRAVGAPADDAYVLWYHGGRLQLMGGERK